MTDIAFIGRMRSGKDTAGGRLCEAHGYTRLAFADPLKDAALALDPWIPYERAVDLGISAARLSAVVDSVGWDRAKSEYPEVRRILQHMGQGVRALEPNFWVNQLTKRWWDLGPDTPTVVTDVRYRNEADALKAHGFKLVRITRPSSWEDVKAAALNDGVRSHPSETELSDYAVDAMIYNGGSLAELYQRVDALTQEG